MAPAKVRAPVPFLVMEIGPEMAPFREREPVPLRVRAAPVVAEMAPAMVPPSWLKVVAPPRVIGAFSVPPTAMRRAPRFSPLPAPTRLRPAKVAPAAGTKIVLPSSTTTVAPAPVKPVVLNLLEVAVPPTWMVPVKPELSPVRKVLAAVAPARLRRRTPAPVKALARVALPEAPEKRAVAPAATATEPVPRPLAAENETVPAWMSVPRE